MSLVLCVSIERDTRVTRNINDKYVCLSFNPRTVGFCFYSRLCVHTTIKDRLELSNPILLENINETMFSRNDSR